MDSISTIIEHTPSLHFLLTAPTSWGKTSLILDLFRNSKRPWLFLSPLKSIALEFFERAKGEFGGSVQWGKGELRRGTLTVATSEMWTEINSVEVVVVLDEFHLFLIWGNDFRPKLLERVEELGAKNITTLALTATIENDQLNYWKFLANLNWENCFHLNLGQGPKKLPKKIIKLPIMLKKYLILTIRFLSRKKRVLIFCKYREEVMEFKRKLNKHKGTVLTCVGGESEVFAKNLKLFPNPQIIIATKALSHGVNLPKIDWVILTYEEDRPEFYWQMIGRGGRKGEDYRVIEFKKSFNWPQ